MNESSFIRMIFVGLAMVWRSFVGPSPASAQEMPVVTIGGQDIRAAGTRLRDDGMWEFHGGRGSFVLAPRELVSWGSPVESFARSRIVLRDGSVVVADPLAMNERALDIGADPRSLARPPIWRATPIERTVIAATIFRPAGDVAARDRMWHDIVTGIRSQDEVWLANGDRLRGSLSGGSRPGGAGNSAMLTLQPKGGGPSLEIAQDQVDAVLWSNATAAPPTEPTVVLGFRDGSLLRVSELSAVDHTVKARAGGWELLADQDEFWREVRYVRSLVAPVQYLSDHEPIGYKHIPLLTMEWPYRRDASVVGGRLRTAGDAHEHRADATSFHEKGLGMHATSRLAYDVPVGTRRLDAAIAVDASGAGQGSVVFRVYGERSDGTFQLAYESPVLRQGAPPVPIRVDVAGYPRVALIVDAADGLDIGDRADWVMARWVLGP